MAKGHRLFDLRNWEVRGMRKAETILQVIRERGRRQLPVERAYRLLYNRDLYIRAYGRIYANDGAMTPGVTQETVDGMTLKKIDRIIRSWKPITSLTSASCLTDSVLGAVVTQR